MTEFLARVSGRRPWLTIGIWLALVATGAALNATLLGSATSTDLRLTGSVESERAKRLLEEKLRGPQAITEIVTIQSQTLTVDDPAFRETVERLHDGILSLGSQSVVAGQHYYLTGDESLVSEDRRTALLSLVMAGDIEQATKEVEKVLDVVADANHTGEFRVRTVGPASIAFENDKLSIEDLEKGERIGVPVALIILLALFGTVAAAFVPLGLGFISVIIALSVVSVMGQFFELVTFVKPAIIMIGLAVGIDYSLFIISRFREELNLGLEPREAMIATGATAGRTVLFSGVTVILALCGMLIVPATFFYSLGVATVLVVIVTLLVTLTLLPAVLTLMGRRVNALPLPYFGRRHLGDGEPHRGRFWEFTARAVTRAPIMSFVAIAVPMVAVTAFYFDIDTGINGVDSFPEGAQTREAYLVLEEQFSFGLVSPAEVVVQGQIDSPEVQQAILKLQQSILEDPTFPAPPLVVPNASGDLALMSVVVPGAHTGQAAVDAVLKLRQEHIPAAFARSNAEVLVGGLPGASADLFDVVDRYTPIVFAFVLGCSFLVLLLVFRSIVIPVKAVIMNLLSVGTAYGLLVLVFQKGVATNLFGFDHADVIDAWIPLFLFTVLFGLSMDYHVFMLSRIRERYDQTGDNGEAVEHGLRSTASLITGAALIMVAVFGAFASGQTIINQIVGFGLSVAILLDATLVRSVLVPASMEVLGRRNWYLPAWLNWLPDVRMEPRQAGQR